jgi:hypothetical protein
MRNEGFIQSIIILVLLLVIVSLLGVSLTSVFNDKTLQENFRFVSEGISIFWNSYGKKYASKLWAVVKGGLQDVGGTREAATSTASSS